MKFEHTEVWGFEHAIRGMRNPKESWGRSDSKFDDLKRPIIGPNDLALMQSLIKAGSEHRKFMRQIFVSVDITAPLYWWKEADTYKVGTVANSTSTMHKIQSHKIGIDLFEIGDYEPSLVIDGMLDEALRPMTVERAVRPFLAFLEHLRTLYNETGDPTYWKELIRWLPEAWLQKRTCTMNYENLLAMCSNGQRRHHKLTEWSGPDGFIAWARTLPYAQELIFLDELEG